MLKGYNFPPPSFTSSSNGYIKPRINTHKYSRYLLANYKEISDDEFISIKMK